MSCRWHVTHREVFTLAKGNVWMIHGCACQSWSAQVVIRKENARAFVWLLAHRLSLSHTRGVFYSRFFKTLHKSFLQKVIVVALMGRRSEGVHVVWRLRWKASSNSVRTWSMTEKTRKYKKVARSAVLDRAMMKRVSVRISENETRFEKIALTPFTRRVCRLYMYHRQTLSRIHSPVVPPELNP